MFLLDIYSIIDKFVKFTKKMQILNYTNTSYLSIELSLLKFSK